MTVERKDEQQFRDLLLKCASTSMSSKLIHHQKPFFANMVVDAVLSLDQDDLDESLIGIKKIAGGGMQDSVLVKGVAFKKAFSYAGFEQQPKSFKNPKILCLNVELELKAERDNAEVRIEHVEVGFFPCTALRSLTARDRIINGSSTPNGRSSSASSKPSWPPGPKSSSPGCPSVISRPSTLRTATSFAPAAYRKTISDGPSKRSAGPSRARRPTSKTRTSARASGSRRSRSAPSATTCSKGAGPPRRAR